MFGKKILYLQRPVRPKADCTDISISIFVKAANQPQYPCSKFSLKTE